MEQDLKRWISASFIEIKQELPNEFQHNKPFPHITLQKFFLEKKISQVAKVLSKETFQEKETDLFKLKQTYDLKGTNNPLVHEFYTFFSSPQFIKYVEAITGIKLAPTIDMSAFIYASTDYLLPHDDKLEGRKIAYILNLSKNFMPSDGGELELFDTKNRHPSASAKKIPPTWNTLTLFEVTPHSFHQVREVLSIKERLSIGGWFHG